MAVLSGLGMLLVPEVFSGKQTFNFFLRLMLSVFFFFFLAEEGEVTYIKLI